MNFPREKLKDSYMTTFICKYISKNDATSIARGSGQEVGGGGGGEDRGGGTGEFHISKNYSECLHLVDKNNWATLSKETKHGHVCLFKGSPAGESIRRGWLKMTSCQHSFTQVFRMTKDSQSHPSLIFFFSHFYGLVPTDILPEMSTRTASVPYQGDGAVCLAPSTTIKST